MEALNAWRNGGKTEKEKKDEKKVELHHIEEAWKK